MSLRLLALAATALIAASALPAAAVPFAGLVGGNQLVGFDSASPGTITSTLNVTGLNAGDRLVGIDTRPATGQFYALGSQSSLSTINTSSGAALFVASLSTAGSPTLLNGTSFGFAFNPVVDRIRIVSDTTQNLRVNPDTGVAIVDGALNYVAGDPNAGTRPNVTAVAYRNQVAGATTTELYDIDTNLDVLATQNPPNAGGLATDGSLGVNASSVAGFDIVGNNDGFASLTVGGTNGFYSINLDNGAATFIGAFTTNVSDIAQAQIGAPAQAVPEPASMAVLGLSVVGLLAARRRRVG